MKKLVLVAVLAIFGLTSSNAQDTKFAVTAGYANVGARVSASGFGSDSVSESGFFAGLSLDIPATEKLHIQPSVLYANANDGNFLIVPVMAKFYVADKFNLQAGPQAQLILEEAVEGISNFGLGLGVGAAYDISEKFYVEARYGFELTNRTNDLVFEGIPVDIKTTFNTLTAGVGYKFN